MSQTPLLHSSGLFYVNGKGESFARVTSVLAMIRKPDVEKLRAMGRLNDQQAKMDWGTAVHAEIDKERLAPPHSVPLMGGYVDSYRNFLKVHGLKVVARKRTVFSLKYKFAGTLDQEIQEKTKPYSLIVVDFKAGKFRPFEHPMQVNAYEFARREMKLAPADKLAVVELQPNGKFKPHWVDYRPESFLQARHLYEGWRYYYANHLE